MLRSILARLRSRLGRDGDDTDEDDTDRGFRRSALDESVLEAHGADVDALDRTIEDIQEQAREIEDEGRHA